MISRPEGARLVQKDAAKTHENELHKRNRKAKWTSNKAINRICLTKKETETEKENASYVYFVGFDYRLPMS